MCWQSTGRLVRQWFDLDRTDLGAHLDAMGRRWVLVDLDAAGAGSGVDVDCVGGAAGDAEFDRTQAGCGPDERRRLGELQGRSPGFGLDDQPVAHRADQPSQDLLASTTCVHVGCVDHVDPGVERLREELASLSFVELAPELHRAQRHRTEHQPVRPKTEESCSSRTSNCEAL